MNPIWHVCHPGATPPLPALNLNPDLNLNLQTQKGGFRLRAVPGGGFEHRPGALIVRWRRDAAKTRRRGRLRHTFV